MRILVTGLGGFVGLHLVRQAAADPRRHMLGGHVDLILPVETSHLLHRRPHHLAIDLSNLQARVDRLTEDVTACLALTREQRRHEAFDESI